MSDWPDSLVSPNLNVVSSLGMDTLLGQAFATAGLLASAVIWTTANTAVYIPFEVEQPFLAQKMAVWPSVASGNLDVGIYDEKGIKMVSLGSTAVVAAGKQVLDIADTMLMPGTYFMAMNCDNITATFYGATSAMATAYIARPCGVQQQAVGAIALPSPATFATFTARMVPLLIVGGQAAI